MSSAIVIRQAGGPEVLKWEPVVLAPPPPGRCCCASTFALRDAAQPHQALERRATTGATVMVP